MTHTRLVLASGSPYRARILEEAGYDVTVDPPRVDERELDHLFESDPFDLAVHLAHLKARDVARRHPRSLVLAGDQVGVLDGAGGPLQLTKQPDEAAAVAQLMVMSGTIHRLVNALVLVRTDAHGHIRQSAWGTDEQVVTMRAFDESEARAYVRRFEPYDSAGSYRLEDSEKMASDEAFVTDVVGEDPSGVLGMPLPLLGRLLTRVGERPPE